MLKPNGNSEPFKQIYKSAIHCSYFANFDDPNFVNKSRIQIGEIEQKDEKEVDERTFRIMTNFKRPSIVIIYKSTGKCYLEPDSFFACFSKVFRALLREGFTIFL